MGDSLIKRVVETLGAEFPQLRKFATLSPIPSLRDWLEKHADALLTAASARARKALAEQLAQPALLAAMDGVAGMDEKSALGRWRLLRVFWGEGVDADGRPCDAVARFHLGNGARVERINWLADPSAKGMKQSCGLMVNYLYDLKRLDKHRALLARGKIPVSSAVESLLD